MTGTIVSIGAKGTNSKVGWGGGVKTWLASNSRQCVWIRTQVPFHLFLPYGPPNQ